VNRQAAKDAKTRERMDGLATVVVDSALTVHRVLGPGFLESVDEEALAIELRARGVKFTRQVSISIRYRRCS
jgi:GxxExxY protein